MPFADPEKNAAYDREYDKRNRQHRKQLRAVWRDRNRSALNLARKLGVPIAHARTILTQIGASPCQ